MPKAHAFDKAVYVLSGQVALRREAQRIRLHEGGYALISAGQRHRIEGLEGGSRWIEICAPQPRKPGRGEPDTVEVPGWPVASGEELVPGDPRAQGCGSFDARMPVPFDMLPGLFGVSVRMLLDVAQGAVHFNLFVVDIQQGGLCDHHDHPFEEAYFLLSGEVELTVEGEQHTLRAGDFAWTGVGAAHAFHAKGPARWIEVQAPLPPLRNGMRWHTPWRQLFSSLLASHANMA
jgi:quercetin dioxygenase-like cupin family protein